MTSQRTTRSKKVLLNDTLITESDIDISFNSIAAPRRVNNKPRPQKKVVNTSINSSIFDDSTLNTSVNSEYASYNVPIKRQNDYSGERMSALKVEEDNDSNKSTHLTYSDKANDEDERFRDYEFEKYEIFRKIQDKLTNSISATQQQIESKVQQKGPINNDYENEDIKITESENEENERTFAKEYEESILKGAERLSEDDIRRKMKHIDQLIKSFSIERNRLKYFLRKDKQINQNDGDETLPTKECLCCGKLISKLCFRCEHLYCKAENCQRKKKQVLNARMLEKMKKKVDVVEGTRKESKKVKRERKKLVKMSKIDEESSESYEDDDDENSQNIEYSDEDDAFRPVPKKTSKPLSHNTTTNTKEDFKPVPQRIHRLSTVLQNPHFDINNYSALSDVSSFRESGIFVEATQEME